MYVRLNVKRISAQFNGTYDYCSDLIQPATINDLCDHELLGSLKLVYLLYFPMKTLN